MFDNVAFQVVIGLVFVYLLYSLLVTILGELIASWMGIRARLLRVAIERMLNDGYYKKIAQSKWKIATSLFKMWYWVTNKFRHFFLYENKEFKNSIAGRFYSHPSVKYLTRLEADQKVSFEKTKPSYLSAENFASTLINFFCDKGNGNDKLEQLRFSLQYNTVHIQPETSKNINNIFSNSGNNIDQFKENLMKWFDETMDRTNGWYKRKIRFILFWVGFFLAWTFNVDTIAITHILANDKEARNQLVTMGVAMSKDSAKYKDVLHINAGDSVISKAIIDSGYSHVSNDIRQANLVIGLGWDFTKMKKKTSVEVDSVKNPILYKDLLRFRDHDNLRVEALKLQKEVAGKLFAIDSLKRESAIMGGKITYDSLLSLTSKDTSYGGEFTRLKSNLQINADSIKRLTTQLQSDSGILSAVINFVKHSDKLINAATGTSLVVIDSLETGSKDNHTILYIRGKRAYNVWEKFCYVAGSVFTKSSRLLGFILTAFALSLGAPFWFGVLNKLVALRGAGVKPEEKPAVEQKKSVISNLPVESVPTSPNVIAKPLNRQEASEVALTNFTDKLKNENGVVAIGLEPAGDTASAIIRVMAENDQVKNFLQKTYGDAEVIKDPLNQATDFSVPVQYSVQTLNEVHSGMAGAEIANKSFKLGHGTMGCYLKKKGVENNYMLSCWHVMKDNVLWDTAIIEKEIIDSANTVIGLVEHGCLADTIDVGIAVCNDKIVQPNTSFQIKSQQREVKSFDALAGTPVRLFGKVCKLQTAKIFHHKINARLKYPDGRFHLMNDVFSITNDMKSPTSGGDSGAIVTDMNGTPLGMIIGGNDVFSYAVKFTNMFDKNKLYSEYSFLI